METPYSTATAARWGGVLLLGVYLSVTIPTAFETWRCGGWFCTFKFVVLTAPMSLILSGGRPLQSNLVGMIIGIVVTGLIVYGIGRAMGRFCGWLLRP